MNVTVLSKNITENYHNMVNQCFYARCYDGSLLQEKRTNASSWEERTNGCAEYYCNDENGPISWSNCNSSDNYTENNNYICMDNKCVERRIGWIVEIEISEFSGNDTEIKEQIQQLTGIEVEEIGFVLDDKGSIIHIILYVNDEEVGETIVKAVESLNKHEGCEYGVLCRTKTIRLISPAYESLSGSTENQIYKILTVIMILFSFFVSFSA